MYQQDVRDAAAVSRVQQQTGSQCCVVWKFQRISLLYGFHHVAACCVTCSHLHWPMLCTLVQFIPLNDSASLISIRFTLLVMIFFYYSCIDMLSDVPHIFPSFTVKLVIFCESRALSHTRSWHTITLPLSAIESLFCYLAISWLCSNMLSFLVTCSYSFMCPTCFCELSQYVSTCVSTHCTL